MHAQPHRNFNYVAGKRQSGKSSHVILTIGHSNHPLDRFIALIEGAGVTAIADVRSKPVSRFVPHFNRNRLEAALNERGIAYLFLGRELGGRPDTPTLLKNGKPDYAAMAQTPSFAAGLTRIVDAGTKQRVALLCAERDPIDCHRFLLIGRALAARSIDVAHILATGEIESHADTERRARNNAPDDLFGR
jgi:uncharacterized protein (DUF488 family)